MGVKADLLEAQRRANKAGDTAEAGRLQKLIDRLKKLRGDFAAGIGPGLPGLTGPRKYTVGKGESPLSIGQKVFGFADLSLVKLIAEFNPKLFQVDPNTGEFIFVGQPGDVLDLSFAAAPGLLPADARFLNAPFGPTAGVPSPPTGGPTTFTSESGIAPSTELRPGIDTPIPPVGDPRTGGSFTPDQLAPPPYNVLPPPPSPEDAFNADFDAGTFPTQPVNPPVSPPSDIPLPTPEQSAAFQASAERRRGLLGFPTLGGAPPPTTPTGETTPGGVTPGVTPEPPRRPGQLDVPTAAEDVPERGVPFIGGIMGGGDDPFTQASAAFTQAIYDASLNPDDPASRELLPLTVPNEVAQFTAPQYASSSNDFSVSATEFMTGLGYWQDDSGDWHRIDITTAAGGDIYRGNGAMYNNGISNRNRYFRSKGGRLIGPGLPGPKKPSPRGGSGASRTFPGTVMWNVRFPELT